MSCSENDRIWDHVVDRFLDGGDECSLEVLFSMDLEDAYNFLMTGELPKN